MTWQILFTPTASRMLAGISDRRIRETVLAVIHRLKEEPEKQGKPLVGELSGCRSIRAAGQRYRVIYAIKGETVTVLIIGVGIRREGSNTDIYNLAKKLLRLGLLERA